LIARSNANCIAVIESTIAHAAETGETDVAICFSQYLLTMTPDLVERTDFDRETEDLSCAFVEEEVGRYDWRNNWLAIRAAGVARERVQRWLQAMKSDHDPDKILACLDQLSRTLSGRWL
jgi:hypothetical protein